MLNRSFYSNGKLLITAEYLVLDGAVALALPTKFGQDMLVQNIDSSILIWESFDENHTVWFTAEFDLKTLKSTKSDFDNDITKTLQRILRETKKLNPEFLNSNRGFHIRTHLNFPINWGLGTSSTFINNIAKWAKIDAFELLNNSFGGSGYDIACAQNDSPVTYKLVSKKPIINQVKFNPVFKDQLYFVHLNKKQSSKEGIAHYNEFKGNINAYAEEISLLTKEMLNCDSIKYFENILTEHEKIIASIIKQNPIQQELFNDYFGQIKSLGAWGGDFILATGNEDSPKYFKNKGFATIVPFQEMIL